MIACLHFFADDSNRHMNKYVNKMSRLSYCVKFSSPALFHSGHAESSQEFPRCYWSHQQCLCCIKVCQRVITVWQVSQHKQRHRSIFLFTAVLFLLPHVKLLLCEKKKTCFVKATGWEAQLLHGLIPTRSPGQALARCALRVFMWPRDVSSRSIMNFMLWRHCAYALVRFRHKNYSVRVQKTKCFSHKHCCKLQKYNVLLEIDWRDKKKKIVFTNTNGECPNDLSKISSGFLLTIICCIILFSLCFVVFWLLSCCQIFWVITNVWSHFLVMRWLRSWITESRVSFLS